MRAPSESGEKNQLPIYEYACIACQHEFETIQKISESPLTECPECGKPKLRKKVSAAGFRLKGGGWYETDFKSGKKKNVHGDAAESSSAKSASGGSSPDSGSKSESKSSDGKSSGSDSKSSSESSASKSSD